MPSEAYRRALAEATAHHAKSKTYSGKFLRPHKPFLLDLAANLDLHSALDWGCGKGAQYTWVDPSDGKTLEQALGFAVAKYDPAWPPFATERPGPYDLVICTHVLGSIPTADLSWVLGRIYGAARKAVFIAEKIGPVHKQVISAQDEHPIGWDSERWRDELAPYASFYGVDTHLSFRMRGPDTDGVHVHRYRWADRRWSFERKFSS